MPRYWMVKIPGEHWKHPLENSLWMMQYQYGEQNSPLVTQNWEAASRISPGDWLVGREASGVLRALGQVRAPRLKADYTGSVREVLPPNRRHQYTEGIVHYSDAPTFYENLRDDNGFEKRQWGQRIDVDKWLLQGSAPVPSGAPATYVSVVEIDRDYFSKCVRTLRSAANQVKAMLFDAEQVLGPIPQIILQGPPGTGKTYAAKRLAARLLGIDASEVDKEEQSEGGGFAAARFQDSGAPERTWELVQFHPSYGYDDFVRGIEADTTEGGQIRYRVVPRVFEKLVEHHARGRDPNRRTVLIIDEINRAKLAQVLGELIYGLEYRGSAIRLPYSLPGIELKDPTDVTRLTVPKEGFFIIGAMNTADRSVGRIDYAVRRRFGFQQVSPDRTAITGQEKVATEQKEWAVQLFDAVASLFNVAHLAPEFHRDDVQVGHTYFLGSNEKVQLKYVYQVFLLLREYLKDGILMQKDQINLKLPSSASVLNVAEDINSSQLLSKLDESWVNWSSSTQKYAST